MAHHKHSPHKKHPQKKAGYKPYDRKVRHFNERMAIEKRNPDGTHGIQEIRP